MTYAKHTKNKYILVKDAKSQYTSAQRVGIYGENNITFYWRTSVSKESKYQLLTTALSLT